MQRRRTFDLVLAIGGVLIVAVLAVLRASQQQAQTSVPSTYDTGASGLAALYEFLQREHVPAGRFESAQLPQGGTVAVAGDPALFRLAVDIEQRNSLRSWVRDGGTLVLLGSLPPSMLDLLAGKNELAAAQHLSPPPASPRAAAVAFKRGKGRVVYVSSVLPFDNLHLARGANARFAYALFASVGPVAFDERIYGYSDDRSAWSVLPQPVRIAVIIAGVALLLALGGANLPFAPPLDLEEKSVRDSSEYLTSLALMLRRAGARRDTVERFRRAVERSLAPHAADPHARSLLEEARHIALQQALSDRDLVHAAHLLTRVRKDYPW